MAEDQILGSGCSRNVHTSSSAAWLLNTQCHSLSVQFLLAMLWAVFILQSVDMLHTATLPAIKPATARLLLDVRTRHHSRLRGPDYAYAAGCRQQHTRGSSRTWESSPRQQASWWTSCTRWSRLPCSRRAVR